MYYSINESTSRTAKELNSFSDYKPGSATAEYRAEVDEAAALVERKKATVSPYNHEKLDYLLDRYAKKLAEYYNAYYRNEASCPSIMISGGSNFPVNKKRKQNARRDTLQQEYQAVQSILRKIESIGTGPIDFADPHARELLQRRVDDAKANHQRMKDANSWYRKHGTLEGCPGLTDKEKEWLTRPGVFSVGRGTPLELYRKPFPAFDLQNSNAAIKRYQDRLDAYNAQQNRTTAPTDFEGGQIVRNVELDRLQIIFDEKPDEETRAKLKANGFRWSPRNQAWQRQLTKTRLRQVLFAKRVPVK